MLNSARKLDQNEAERLRLEEERGISRNHANTEKHRLNRNIHRTQNRIHQAIERNAAETEIQAVEDELALSQAKTASLRAKKRELKTRTGATVTAATVTAATVTVKRVGRKGGAKLAQYGTIPDWSPPENHGVMESTSDNTNIDEFSLPTAPDPIPADDLEVDVTAVTAGRPRIILKHGERRIALTQD